MDDGAPKLEGIHDRGGVPVELGENPLQFLADAGYTGIVATNSEFEIERYPRVGDDLTAETVFETISDEKKTAMGTGFFVTWMTTYRNQDGEVIGRQRFRTLRFKTGTEMAQRLAPSISPDTEFFWSGLKEGELRIQRCANCKTLRVPPRPMCGKCQSLDWDYVVSSGHGTVYSFVMPQYPPLPFLQYPTSSP